MKHTKAIYFDHSPDGWVIIKLNKDDYRIFGSWAGGYVSSDIWRCNSGCVSSVKAPDGWYVYGDSGSCYAVGIDNYGYLTGYNHSILEALVDKNNGVVLSKEEAFEFLDGIVSKGVL